MEEALHNITLAVQHLEEAIVLEQEKHHKNKEKIEALQTVIKTSYDRINKAIENAKKQQDDVSEKGEDICLSLS